RRVVDVQRVDADQHGTGPGEPGGGLGGQVGVSLKIRVGPPVDVPAGGDQDRLAAHVQGAEGGGVDGPAAGERPAHRDGVEVGQLFEGQLRQVLAVGVAVEGRVEVGAGVGDHLDLADVELGPRRVQLP